MMRRSLSISPWNEDDLKNQQNGPKQQLRQFEKRLEVRSDVQRSSGHQKHFEILFLELNGIK
jgi:hypothetical protein